MIFKEMAVFCELYLKLVNFSRPQAMSIHKNSAISLKPIHFFGKMKLIFHKQVRNSMAQLTLVNYLSPATRVICKE